MPIINIRIGATYCTSKYEYNHDHKRWEYFANENLIEQLSSLLSVEHAEIIDKENMIEKRIDLYVASPEVFWRIVKEEAEKIVTRFMNK